MTRLTVLLLLALPAVGKLEYADGAGGMLLPKQALRDAFALLVEDGGRLLLPDREVLTLAQLDRRLARARAAYDGKHGVPDKRYSNLPVVLHVDRNAPWFHAQLVLAAAARARCPRVWFAVGNGGTRFIDVRLPVGREVARNEMRFTVALVPTEWKPRAWPDGGTVQQPAGFTFAFEGIDAPMDMFAARAVAEALATGQDEGVVCRALVAPAPSLRFGHVVQAIRVFARRKYRWIDFQAIAGRRLDASARRLPFPDARWSPPKIAEPIGGRSTEDVRPFDGGPVDAGVRTPLAPGGARDGKLAREGRRVVNLTADGRIRVDDKECSLQGFLHVMAADDRPRALLRVDGAAPWQHVMHVLTALSRAGVETVEFSIRGRADRGDRPRDALEFGVPRTDEDPDPARHAAVVAIRLRRKEGEPSLAEALRAVRSVRRDRLEMTAEREVEAAFGLDGRKAMRPLVVRFTWNGRSTCSFPRLVGWIVRQRAAQLRESLIWDKKLRAVLSVSEKVPARYPVAILARLYELGWRELYFFDRLSQEGAALLHAPALPYPESDRPLAGDDGLGDAPVPDSADR